MRKFLLLVAAFLLFAAYGFAQTRTVTGTVTDESGNPISNASVLIKGTSNGTSTDNNGYFTINVPDNRNALVFTAVGYSEKELTVTQSGTVLITLASTTAAMDEVVVVAYGTQRRSRITGSVNTIGSDQLEGRITTNITQALAGAAPGIATTSGNGQPGASAPIRIRGFGSVNAGSDPLIVVDGFPFGGSMSDINTNDVESITLLKDATSTALYGARAANGVVMITTKRGKSARPKVSIDLLTGKSQRAVPEYETVDAYQYYPLYWQAYRNGLVYGATPVDPVIAGRRSALEIGPQLVYNPFNVNRETLVDSTGKFNPNAKLLYDDFDWFSPMINNGPRNEANFSISSKSNQTDYFVGLNYIKDEGFIIKSDFERVSARVNINTNVTQWFRTGINMNGAMVKSNLGAGTGDNTFINPFVFARGIGPIYPVHAYDNTGQPVLDQDGKQYYDYGMHPGSVNRPSGASPGRHIVYETMLNTNFDRRQVMSGRTYAEISFLKNFKFTNNVGLDLSNIKNTYNQNKTVGDGVTLGGYTYRDNFEYKTVTVNQLLNYSNQFDEHNIDFLLGHENSWYDVTSITAAKVGMNLDGNIEFPNFVTLRSIGGGLTQLRREGYFARANYDLAGKYFFDIAFRRDASSRFSPKSRWGNFYSIGAGWNLIKENFVANTEVFSDLRFRAAFGTVGNDDLESYYAYQQLYTLGFNNGAEAGALASSLRNDDLTWEVGKNFTVGLDFGVLKNRLSGTIEFFKRGSSALLFDVPLGYSSIVTNVTRNIGAMENTGIEIQLSGDIIRTENARWNMLVNFTSLKNKMKTLPNNNEPITSGTKRYEVGSDIYQFYLRQWYGVDPSDGSALYYKNDTYHDIAGIRVIGGDSLVTSPTNAVFAKSGSAIPKFFGSLTNSFSYKNFGLSFLLNYQVGGKFYDGNYAGLMALASYGKSLHVDLLDAWKAPGDITDVPRLDINRSSDFNAASNRWLIDASYLSLRNATAYYNLPTSLLTRLKFDVIRVFISGENIFILSKRKGLNPMETFNGTNSPVYTPNRVLSLGINLTF